ncbi:MAG: hypothetical protein AVDCRST_MAG59-1564 [uncultured Thermomicrobiales bacterium]|uniref:Uncharacterized protein n=1 Tax=uncultured Thermomicrobiales bacterium TaxID=1645740 RepID=A0A6J4UGJ5_9BACT|nr:MAG: hypothetical protein AVDCRST_MAG59-1564 [uncultured Thermomicrobiales bacterium]
MSRPATLAPVLPSALLVGSRSVRIGRPRWSMATSGSAHHRGPSHEPLAPDPARHGMLLAPVPTDHNTVVDRSTPKQAAPRGKADSQ